MKFTSSLDESLPPWCRKGIKIILAMAIVTFSFFSPRAGILVEGSLSTIIDNSEVGGNPSSNQSFYSSEQTFLQNINSPQERIITREVIVTAYSSTPDQTDSTPFITASGQRVRDGIIASNFLPFGTKVQFPQLFGSKIFEVEDRMHKKYSDNRVDIWFPDRASAEMFGVKKTIMRIVE